MRKRTLQLATALVLTSCSIEGARAAESGWYVGLGLGQSKYGIKKEDLPTVFVEASGGSSGPSSFDDSDTAVAGVVGFRFSPYLAVEATYTDLGKLHYRASRTLISVGPFPTEPFPTEPLLPTEPVDTNTQLSAAGPTLALVGSLPVTPSFDVHARGGVFFAKTKTKLAISIGGPPQPYVISASSQDVFYGLGVGFALGQHWAFSADWQQYQDVGDRDKTGQGDIRALTASAFYRF